VVLPLRQNEGSLPKLLSRLSGLFGGPAPGGASALPTSNSFFPSMSTLPTFSSMHLRDMPSSILDGGATPASATAEAAHAAGPSRFSVPAAAHGDDRGGGKGGSGAEGGVPSAVAPAEGGARLGALRQQLPELAPASAAGNRAMWRTFSDMMQVRTALSVV
jgi:hypothetical protein